jgi:hypothetical protein
MADSMSSEAWRITPSIGVSSPPAVMVQLASDSTATSAASPSGSRSNMVEWIQPANDESMRFSARRTAAPIVELLSTPSTLSITSFPSQLVDHGVRATRLPPVSAATRLRAKSLGLSETP